MKTSRVALASLIFTLLFFAEYIPPFRQVHVPYDLEGFHYPLADYAFQSLKHGHIPQWDPTVYAGMSFNANIQAALFYPPAWLMYAASVASAHLSYQALQDLVFAHVWLAFLLCYCWLRDKSLLPMAAALGAGVFAFSGYLCTQLQHFGLVAAYTWFPLGLWGIDQAMQRRSWKPLWKLALASALCLLAGYPPTWVVFLVCMLSYGLCSAWLIHPRKLAWKLGLAGVLALTGSLALSAVQLLPTWEATRMVDPDPRYGLGIPFGYLLESWLIPNLYHFGLNVPVNTNLGKDYFYLGAPALLGLLCLLRRISREQLRTILPVALMFLVCLVFVTNPLDSVWTLVQHSTLLASLVRDWYFLAGVSAGFAGLAAFGLDYFLRNATPTRQPKAWATAFASGLALVWITANLFRWQRSTLPFGWWSAADALLAVGVFTALLWLYRQSPAGPRQALLALLILLLVGVEYKAFGTSKRFDASAGSGPHDSVDIPNALGPDVYREMLAHPDNRVLLEELSILPAKLRSVGLSTPQGFDPLLTTQLRRVVEASGRSLSDRTFEIDPGNDAALQLFGVRYVIARTGSPLAMQLSTDPRYRQRISSAPPPIQQMVFEFGRHRPLWRWETDSPVDSAQVRVWTAEERTFQVRSARGGRLTLAEQYHPGWSVSLTSLDFSTAQTTITAPDRWQTAFQSVAIGPGSYRATFRFQSRWLPLGAAISLTSVLGLLWWIRADQRRPKVS